MSVGRVLAAVVDASGVIVEVIVDTLDLGRRAGEPFAACLDAGSHAKAAAFLSAAADGAAHHWELSVVTREGPRLLSFHATRHGEQVIIIGCETGEDLGWLFEDMSRINNEHANLLRAALKDLTTPSGRPPDLYDQLTALNNELAAVQRQLAKQNLELAQINEAKDRVLGAVAHDLRNPIGAITGFATLMRDGETGPVNDLQREFLGRIETSGAFMLQLVEDLLDLRALESGQVSLVRRPFDLHAMLEDEVAVAKLSASKKHIELQLDGAPLELDGDERKLRQVVANLLSNANKYSHQATIVRIATSIEPGQVRVSVADQGQGIPQAELSSLFKPFGVTSVQSTAGEKSTGLGLSIARRIIEAHGGTIGVDSTQGEGSTFWFALPLAAPG